MKAFISYSHADERYVDRLRKHLAMLHRDKLLTHFYDRDIMLGDQLNAEIADQLADSQIFLAIVSPDFLASDYCYDIELATALQMHHENRIRVVSVVVEPCEWQKSPLGAFLVAPKDGKAIAEWENENAAFLNVVSEIRLIAEKFAASSASVQESTKSLPQLDALKGKPAKRYLTKRTFDDVARYKFRVESFASIREHFRRSVDEVNLVPEIQAHFRDIDSYGFTATVLNEAFGRGLGHITIRMGGNSGSSMGDIFWSEKENAPANTANGWVSIKNNDYELFFEASPLSFFLDDRDLKKLTADQLGDFLWDVLIKQAGISHG